VARPLTRDEPLDAPVKARLTATEAAEVRQAAAASGLSVSDFLRACLVSGGPQVRATGRATPGRRRPDLSRRRYAQIDQDLLFQLSQAGNSLNQVAHRLNSQNVIGAPLDVVGAAHSLKQIELALAEIFQAHLK
jgi:hypothetical protein